MKFSLQQTLTERSQWLAFFNHLESLWAFLPIHIITQAVHCGYSSSIRIHGMEIQFEDDTISLELLGLPSGWTITDLTPPVVRLCHSIRVSNLQLQECQALFPTSDYKATSRSIFSWEGNPKLPAPGGVWGKRWTCSTQTQSKAEGSQRSFQPLYYCLHH